MHTLWKNPVENFLIQTGIAFRDLSLFFPQFVIKILRVFFGKLDGLFRWLILGYFKKKYTNWMVFYQCFAIIDRMFSFKKNNCYE